jgi:arylsulfatase A-like enzyme
VISRRSLLLGAPAAARAAAAKRPNIVLILPDQFRGQALGCAGNEQIRTPNLDRLAGEGAYFPNTFANTPVCCPARAVLLTGKYCHRNGMVANDLRLRESQRTIAQALQNAGYRTGFIGKWHLDGGKRLPGYVPPGARRHGFEYWAANECDHRPFDTHYFRDDEKPIPIGKFEAEGWVDRGIEFLEQSRDDKRPFCLMLFTGPPHDPYTAPEKYLKLYDPERIVLRPNWRNGSERVPGRKEIAAYYAAITAVDDQIGRLVSRLDSLGLRDDTILTVCSDHGDMLGSQGMRLKRKPWEESIRVPGIIRYPRKIRPGTRDALFSHIDYAPTMLGLAGVKGMSDLQGADFSGYLTGSKARTSDSVYFQIFGPYRGDGTPHAWRGIRTCQFMYARTEQGPWVLYDLDKDPFEQTNLATAAAAEPTRRKLEARLEQWFRSTGDSWKFDWTHPVEDDGRLYRHKTFYTVDEYLEWARQNPDLDRGK